MPLTQDQIRDRLTALLADMAPAVIATAPTVSVKAGDNLAAVLAAQTIDGTVYLLAPGLTYAGDLPFTKPCTLMTDEPAPLTRARPTDPYGTLIGAFVVEAPDVSFHNIAFGGDASRGTMLTTGLRTSLDRCFLRGNAAGQHRGIAANSGGVTIVRCFIDNIFSDQDTQAIAGWDGTADLLVDDCYLESSGENVILGGADASSPANIPQRVTLQNCSLSKRLAWRGVPGITIKNLLELKNATDVLIQNNVGSYSWLSGQDGYAVLLTVRNQDGTNPYAILARITLRGNTWSHLGAGIQILGQDDSNPSQRMTDVLIQHETFIDVDPGNWGGDGRQVYIAGGPKNLTLDGLQFDGAHLNSAFSFGDDPALLCETLVVTGGRYQEGDYGIKCAGFAPGTPSLAARAPGYAWSGVTMQVGNPLRSDGSAKGTIPYPAGTTVIP